MKYVAALPIIFLMSPFLFAETDGENKTVGCWESNAMKYGNSTKVCVNDDSAEISFFFANKDEKTGLGSPTICTQPADVEYKNENTLIIRGFIGECENGRKQAPITLKCTLKENEKMPCEMYLDHQDLSFTKVKNRSSQSVIAEDVFEVRFGYLSIDKDTQRATLIKETDTIDARPGVAWGFIVYPSKKGVFVAKSIQEGNCAYEEEALIDGPYSTWSFYEYFELTEVTKPCAESIHVYINDELVETINYRIRDVIPSPI